MNIVGLLLGALLAMGVVMSGCQPASPDQIARERGKAGFKSNQPQTKVTEASLAGTWNKGCTYDADSEFYKLEKIEITGDYLEYTTQFSKEPECAAISYAKKLSGFYTLDGEKITITYKNIDLTPEGTFAALFNSAKRCGEIGWESGKMRTFTDFALCSEDVEKTATVQRYGANELFLGSSQFILNKKTTELQ